MTAIQFPFVASFPRRRSLGLARNAVLLLAVVILVVGTGSAIVGWLNHRDRAAGQRHVERSEEILRQVERDAASDPEKQAEVERFRAMTRPAR